MDIGVLNSIEQLSNVNKENKEDIEKSIPEVVDYLEGKGVHFSENTMIGFVTHSIALLGRIKTGNKLDDIGQEIAKQIEPKCLQLSKEAFKIIENKFNVELDDSEIILGAIHIMNALQDNN